MYLEKLWNILCIQKSGRYKYLIPKHPIHYPTELFGISWNFHLNEF